MSKFIEDNVTGVLVMSKPTRYIRKYYIELCIYDPDILDSEMKPTLLETVKLASLPMAVEYYNSSSVGQRFPYRKASFQLALGGYRAGPAKGTFTVKRKAVGNSA